MLSLKQQQKAIIVKETMAGKAKAIATVPVPAPATDIWSLCHMIRMILQEKHLVLPVVRQAYN